MTKDIIKEDVQSVFGSNTSNASRYQVFMGTEGRIESVVNIDEIVYID